VPEKLIEPLRWSNPKTVFVNSMSDLFQDAVPDAYIEAVAQTMLEANWHTYQVLTKRSNRLQELLTTKLKAAAGAAHIWWGVSVEDKKYGIPRIRHLQCSPATVRFLSIEPLLEDLGKLDLKGIHWVIVGGESGPGARPMDPAWVTAIKQQCEAQRSLFFFKQWGGVRKAKRGRRLDGEIYDAMPAPSTNAPPPRAMRERLLEQLTPATHGWSNSSLVQLTHHHSVA
jgi:protein gp37